LEKLLQLKEDKQRSYALFQAKADAAARTIQSFARVCSAKNQLELLRVERSIMIYVALFLQSSYRGIKDRKRVEGIKSEYSKYIRQPAAAVQLQQHARCFLAKRRLFIARREKEELVHLAASKIQSLERSRVCRLAFKCELQKRLECMAVTKLQNCFRSYHSRRLVEGLRRDRRKKKPEKASSLYDRRYSTYSVKAVITQKPQRQSAGTVTAPLPQSNKPNRKRHLNKSKMATSSSHSNQAEDLDRKNKVSDDQVVTLAQQKASERVAELGRRVKQEKKKQQLEANKVHEKLKQLEQSRRGLVSSTVPKKTTTDHQDDPLVSSELKSSDAGGSDENDEFEDLIPENENDID
jgi:hypothetical protein